jgi:hypothetical protein
MDSFCCIEIIVGQILKAAGHGGEGLLIFLLTGGGKGCQGPAVKGIQCSQDFTFMSTSVIKVFSYQLDGGFVCLGSAVAEKYLSAL